MHFISKLLQGMSDAAVHRAFLRYGKGDYDGPAAEITITRAGKVKVSSNYLYQDLFARILLQTIPDETLNVSGTILAYEKLDKALANIGITAPPFTKKRKMLLYETQISGKYAREQLFKLYDEIGESAYIFCTLTTASGWLHKSKTKIPSAQKEASIVEQIKFSTTTIPPNTSFLDVLLQELLPDFTDNLSSSFHSLLLVNHYHITDFEFPRNRDQLTSTEIRRLTKRKGYLRRVLRVDGAEFSCEHSFSA